MLESTATAQAGGWLAAVARLCCACRSQRRQCLCKLRCGHASGALQPLLQAAHLRLHSCMICWQDQVAAQASSRGCAGQTHLRLDAHELRADDGHKAQEAVYGGHLEHVLSHRQLQQQAILSALPVIRLCWETTVLWSHGQFVHAAALQQVQNTATKRRRRFMEDTWNVSSATGSCSSTPALVTGHTSDVSLCSACLSVRCQPGVTSAARDHFTPRQQHRITVST